ncbi:MAG TPA: DUF488 domain-containing protein [Terriglobales bacterium]|nr:DUF488 domain-containing protein [Terriglobales bacterium]
MVTLKRVYDKPESADGKRFLIERLWPRGVNKTSLKFDAWIKDAGPSTELRKWFRHDPEKWIEFRRRYFAELNARPKVLESITKAAAEGNVTLLYSSHDTQHNNAVALKEYLEGRMKSSHRGKSRAHGHAA